jgi:5'-methylthioadenosine phosphorylase
MQQEINPGEIIVPDGWILYANVNRVSTFFWDEGAVIHISTEPPYCPGLRTLLEEEIARLGYGSSYGSGGLYFNIQGPHFLSEKESRVLGRVYPECSVIGMSAYPGGVLAREAEMCYALVDLVTDYNHLEGKPHVSNAEVLNVARENNRKAQAIIKAVAARNHVAESCMCWNSLDGAVMTYREDLVNDWFVRSLLERFEKT